MHDSRAILTVPSANPGLFVTEATHTFASLRDTLTAESKPRPKTILIASHSERWRETVVSALDTMPVVICSHSDVLLEHAGRLCPALVVLDSALEDCTGLAALRALREIESGRNIRVMVLQSLATEMDRILAFENGADDFVAAPFFSRELQSRVQALLRRREAARTPRRRSVLSFEDFEVDLRAGAVCIGGRRAPLTTREFDVLRVLVQERGRVVPRGELLGHSGNEVSGVSPRAVDTHVKSIRRKLGTAGRCIETVRGVGYRFSASPGNSSPRGGDTFT